MKLRIGNVFILNSYGWFVVKIVLSKQILMDIGTVMGIYCYMALIANVNRISLQRILRVVDVM